MPLVFSGSINILRQDDHGNEVLLYYLEKGKTCAMSMSCCMKEKKSNIWAIAEEDTQLLLVPVEKMDFWMKKYSSWKNFVMNSYSSRMDELLYTLDAIAFYSLDERLLKYLKDRSSALQKVEFHITHSEVAKELNSSREAISRLLKITRKHRENRTWKK
jgi:CRP/FNR family transcriptional regulator